MKIVNVNVSVVVIKLKDLLFEQKEEKKIHSLVSNWKHEMAQKYASLLIDKYGKPDVEGGKMLLWRDVELIDEEKYKYKVRKIIFNIELGSKKILKKKFKGKRSKVSLSLSDEKKYAVAFVTISL
mgnify:CR=1 FL=1